MLRISYSQTDGEQTWTLCGQLAGPWVQELRTFWNQTEKTAADTRRVVNLNEVTFIDHNGERLLSEMESAGATFVARGVATRYLIETLCGAKRN